LHAAYEKSDESLAISLKTEIDQLKDAIYKREERRQKKKAEKLAANLKKKEEKNSKRQQLKAKGSATAPAAIPASNGTLDGETSTVPKVVKKKKAEPKVDLAVRIVNEEPDTDESIKQKLEQKLLVRGGTSYSIV